MLWELLTHSNIVGSGIALMDQIKYFEQLKHPLNDSGNFVVDIHINKASSMMARLGKMVW